MLEGEVTAAELPSEVSNMARKFLTPPLEARGGFDMFAVETETRGLRALCGKRGGRVRVRSEGGSGRARVGCVVVMGRPGMSLMGGRILLAATWCLGVKRDLIVSSDAS